MKILVVRVGRLGDIVMMLPAIAAIQERHPNAEIFALTSADGARLLKAYGMAPDHIHCYSNHMLKRLQQTQKVRQFLMRHQFDQIYCFEQKKRTVSWLPDSALVLDDTHQQDHYALRCLKMVTDQPARIEAKPYLPTPDFDIQPLLAQYGISKQTLLIGLHPTYSGFNKLGRVEEKKHRLWPVKAFVDLVDRLNQYGKQQGFDLRLIMDLLPEERRIGLAIESKCRDKLIVLCEAPHFARYLTYLNRLNVLVAPNTGVMHLAAALNTPTVALFSGANPGDCGPYMHPSQFRVVEACHYSTDTEQMANIPAEAVAAQVINLLTTQIMDRKSA